MSSIVDVQHRFHCLSWGGFGVDDGSRPNGMIAGGMDSGVIQLWDPTAIIEQRDSERGKLPKHNGPVRTLDFNPSQWNLLASGGSSGDMYIWDVNRPDAPMTPGAKPAQIQYGS
ncbi:hypothetical protein SARC_05841 [Sphaeroforma arctica JP610]|uniref:Uncharacterized protein n=1 Tax=Sphaeroforma arctica JP610 TaxID=667725 RepID=A0A0L0FYD9_9EUKA|nr:hypothetical protein SARC_05841 [Sphaeroforma arctica JP610]KNC81850.1 hypothetical protein SARC_05841 [Sphaeroforma arctica JP610]|eukprot:XP_014155752.1 hypothetical protein SARC_05841 [Sphaeroforma arctica JP610]